jgi:hypothetical protein
MLQHARGAMDSRDKPGYDAGTIMPDDRWSGPRHCEAPQAPKQSRFRIACDCGNGLLDRFAPRDDAHAASS